MSTNEKRTASHEEGMELAITEVMSGRMGYKKASIRNSTPLSLLWKTEFERQEQKI